MIFPTAAPAGLLVPVGTSFSRAVDVLIGLPLFLPQERLAAVNMLHQFARDRFGPEAPETVGIRELHKTISENAGGMADRSLFMQLLVDWRAEEATYRDDEDEPITRTRTVAPLFDEGSLKFFQAPDVPVPIVRGESSSFGTLGGGYLVSNERNFHRYFDGVKDLGGVTLGLGSLQNLDLAVAAGASGVIFADISPTVSMTLALLLPQLKRCRTPQEFREAGEALIRRDEPSEPFLEKIPEGYRPAFGAHLTSLRESPTYSRALRRYFMGSLLNPYSFLGSQASYERAADLAARGAIALIYGNFFGEDMPDLVSLAMRSFQDPIRVIQTTNAAEVVVTRGFPASAGPLLELMESPHVDPNGRFLTSTELGGNVGRLKGAAGPQKDDAFRYHSVRVVAASTLLRAYGHLAPFVRRFEREEGI